MKKFFAVSVIGLSLALGFTSCSDDDDSSSSDDGDDMEETTCVTCQVATIDVEYCLGDNGNAFLTSTDTDTGIEWEAFLLAQETAGQTCE